MGHWIHDKRTTALMRCHYNKRQNNNIFILLRFTKYTNKQWERWTERESEREKVITKKKTKMSIYLVPFAANGQCLIGSINVRFKIPARIMLLASFGVVGPAECGVNAVWLIDFWRTSRIFSCKLCLFGKISECFICGWEIMIWFDIVVQVNRLSFDNPPGNHWCPWSWETCRTNWTVPWPAAVVVPTFCGVPFRRGHRAHCCVR